MPASIAHATDIRGLPSVTIMASSSLTKPMSQLVRQYSAENIMTVAASFDSSSYLAEKIAEGQEADIFISSNQEWLIELKQLGVLNVNSVTTLMENQLVLVASNHHPATKNYSNAPNAEQILADIASNKLAAPVFVVGDMESVALGKYTQQYLENTDFLKAIKPYFLPVGSSSKALYMVAKGGHIGIIYASDAHNNDEITVLATIDPTLHDRIIYWAAVVIDEQMEHALQFLNFLKKDSTKELFHHYGFIIE